MSSKYNLTDNVKDDFPFEIRGLQYIMRYPITEEVEEIQKKSNALQEAQDSNDDAKIDDMSKEIEDYLYSFISPVEHETSIKEALKKENIKVMQRFNIMIREELSIS